MSLDPSPPEGAPSDDPPLARMLSLLESMDARMSRLEARMAELRPPPSDTATAQTGPVGADAGSPDGPAALVAALSQPETVAVMLRLIDRIDMVDASLSSIAQVPDLAAGAVDTVDRLVAAARASGIDLDGRLQASLALAERLSDPETVEALLKLTDHVGELADAAALVPPSVKAVGALPDVVAVATDTVRRLVDQMEAEGMALEYRLQGVLAVTAAITEPRTLAALERLLDDPARLEQLADVAEQGMGVVARTLAAPTEPVGAWGAFRALSDADVQHGLGVLVALARAIGQRGAA